MTCGSYTQTTCHTTTMTVTMKNQGIISTPENAHNARFTSYCFNGSSQGNQPTVETVAEFLARDSMLSALYAIANPSVCLSVTRVDQSKTV